MTKSHIDKNRPVLINGEHVQVNGELLFYTKLSLTKEDKTRVVAGLKSWLGSAGHAFFEEMLAKHGEVSPVFMEHGIPRIIHHAEGRQVRNFLRTVPDCKDMGCHELDDNWADLVKEAIAGGYIKELIVKEK